MDEWGFLGLDSAPRAKPLGFDRDLKGATGFARGAPQGYLHQKILSDKILFSEIDLKKPNPSKTEKSVVVEITKDGVLNSLRLTSPLKVFDNIAFDSSDSLMPPVIIPLTNDVKVLAGNKVRLVIEYNFESGWDKLKCEATLF